MRNRIPGSVAWCILSLGTAAGQVTLNTAPSRALGHVSLRQVNRTPNLVEGRELNRPNGVAVDATRRIVWVVDTGNHRVLGWRNANSFDNGARADYVLGQRDFLSTEPLGPGTQFTAGLNVPTGVAVDAAGNVYVADCGNNRIIRYPKPFDQTDDLKLADMVIGQASFSTRDPNRGGVSERSLQLSTAGGQVYRAFLAFDAQGNLWVVDAGNHRILRFPANSLGDNAASNPGANLVLGQPDFGSNTPLPSNLQADNRLRKNAFREPSSIAFDQAGRLFVTDSLNRALVFRPPFTSSMEAARLMGIVPPTPQGQPPPQPINEYTLGFSTTSGQVVPAEGIFTIGNTVFVSDTGANRVLRFDSFDQWPAESQSVSPAARAVIGQDSLQQTQIRRNRGASEPSAVTLLGPLAAVFANGELFLVDSENNRLLAYGDVSSGPPLAAGAPYNARRVLGQDRFDGGSINLTEGKEFFFNAAGAAAAGIAIDHRSNPPRLYVADTGNNRILCFEDARRVRTGDRAALVIGQADLSRTLINFSSGDPNERNASGLYQPTAVAVDREGNVWVADIGNSRVLRFPNPFANPNAIPQADLVIGQTNFTNRLTDATARTMSAPYGIAFSAEGHLFVSDIGHNRVLQFSQPFSNGMSAARVFGQADFSSSVTGNTENRLNQPRHISFDTDDRLYVADTNNNRIQIFSRAPAAGTDPRAALSLARGLNRPFSVYVSPQTGEIWVASTNTNQAFRYPNFDRLIAAGDQPDFTINTAGPAAIGQDPFGSLYIAELINRVAIYYPAVAAVNAANYLPRITPGMWASLQCSRFNYSFTDATDIASTATLPRSLGDLRISMNGIPAPMYFISPFQINFVVPWGLPTSGTAELLVEQVSTGRIIAATEVLMDVASPAFFTSGGTGTGQIAAINAADNTINGVGPNLQAVQRGQVITLYGTGQGPVDNSPPDGEPASGITATSGLPIVIMNNARLPDSEILYSGLAPGLVGVWQLNLHVPTSVPPGNQILIVVTYRDIPNNNPQNLQQIRTTIAVR